MLTMTINCVTERANKMETSKRLKFPLNKFLSEINVLNYMIMLNTNKHT